MAKLYRLNAEERQLIDLAAQDPNYFTDYYLRGPNSGTWWLPGATTSGWARGYQKILAEWEKQSKPELFQLGSHEYRAVMEHEKTALYPDLPAFHHNHGLLMLPWGKQLHQDPAYIRVVIGGMGSSKTWAGGLSFLVHAATLPGYRGFVLAPNSTQAEEVYRQMLLMFEGTLFQERFVIDKPIMRPNPRIKIGNDYVGENTIEFYPIQDNVAKLLTLTGDEAMIDQSEQLDNLDEVIRVIGTRFRGRIGRTGRSRLGKITLIANSADNQQLWDLYDMSQTEEHKLSHSGYIVSSYDNPYITEENLKKFEMFVGNDPEAIRVHMKGERPLGNGREFSADVLNRNRSLELDAIMKTGIDNGWPGYHRLYADKLGYYEWMLPYQPDRKYMQMSDPGTANPPHRNSPPIMVWDITEFPRKPATLVAFVWVMGNGDIRNWATRYAELVARYHTHGQCGFDATGPQASYDTWMYILEDLLVEKMTLTGNSKAMMLNSAKMLFSKGLFSIPAELSSIFGQLSRYDLLEDKDSSKMRQDIVMTVIMSAWWLMRLYYSELVENNNWKREDGWDPRDRYYRDRSDRYTGHER